MLSPLGRDAAEYVTVPAPPVYVTGVKEVIAVLTVMLWLLIGCAVDRADPINRLKVVDPFRTAVFPAESVTDVTV